jgi:hypothetical protein
MKNVRRINGRLCFIAKPRPTKGAAMIIKQNGAPGNAQN